jgi:phosphate uptake regulator
MQGVRRKRVTQVGSGAYSIYLPKKWIDAWSPEQKVAREVDLHVINNSLLIVPAVRRRRYEAAVSTDQATVRVMLVSAYSRGYNDVTLRPQDEDCVAMARDLLRHLDERLLTTVGSNRIAFTLQENLPAAFASGDDLLQRMATKLREMVSLAGECVEAYGTRPQRAIHSAQLLHAMHEEDLHRLYHQALRLVANLELPLGNVSDFQLLDLVAAELETVGRKCVAVSQAVLTGHGIPPSDVRLPRADLAARVKPIEAHPILTSVLRVYGRSFEEAGEHLARLSKALQQHDLAGLMAVIEGATHSEQELNRRLYATIEGGLGDARIMSPEAYTAYTIRHATGSLFSGLARAADRAANLTAAQERP